ncbi:Polymer-forming bactofilin [hydrothermal vent metagenome]|uniref:Polymer-forming bactofilin n=1 Tax=hydrothermal vent metagenome TaxID=652676 RepID=A0A3B0Y7G8_9ZZZZ
MFNGKKPGVAKIDTLVGRNTVVEGDVIFTGGLHVDGCIKGNVIAEKDSLSVLTLSEKGRIEGEVRVPHIILNGSVEGDVHAMDRVVLASQANVTGNVYYLLIEMAIGASVNGSLVHVDNDKKPKLITHSNKAADNKVINQSKKSTGS